MFNSKYPYRSSISKTFKEFQKNIAGKIKKKIKPKKILEIGSNDGNFARHFKKKIICVEPCSNLVSILKKNFKVYCSFWDKKLAKKILRDQKNLKFDLIYSANTISHIKNLKEVFEAIKLVILQNGVLVIEDPSLLECLKMNSYDQFYNEHIYIFSLIALKKTLERYNFEIFDVEKIDIHGGSLRYFIKLKTNKNFKISLNVKKQIKEEKKNGLHKPQAYLNFAKRVNRSKNMLVQTIKKLKSNGNSLIGYGATAKSATVLNFCALSNRHFDYFVDTTPDKFNKFISGTNVKIIPYSRKLFKQKKFVFLGAWNFKKEILKKEKNFIKLGGKFLTHIPFPRILK